MKMKKTNYQYSQIIERFRIQTGYTPLSLRRLIRRPWSFSVRGAARRHFSQQVANAKINIQSACALNT
jgi:hypothetical protein